jgi:hypothetical protein
MLVSFILYMPKAVIARRDTFNAGFLESFVLRWMHGLFHLSTTHSLGKGLRRRSNRGGSSGVAMNSRRSMVFPSSRVRKIGFELPPSQSKKTALSCKLSKPNPEPQARRLYCGGILIPRITQFS